MARESRCQMLKCGSIRIARAVLYDTFFKGPYGLTILSRFSPRNGILGFWERSGIALGSFGKPWETFREVLGCIRTAGGAPGKLITGAYQCYQKLLQVSRSFFGTSWSFSELCRSSPELPQVPPESPEASPTFCYGPQRFPKLPWISPAQYSVFCTECW